jgi:hypothetical protein
MFYSFEKFFVEFKFQHKSDWNILMCVADIANLVYKLLHIHVKIGRREIEKKAKKRIKECKIKTLRLIKDFKKAALVKQ